MMPEPERAHRPVSAPPPPPPPLHGRERQRQGQPTARVLIMAALGLLLAGAYYAIAPESGLYPRCLFLQLTGWECPGCGSQRAIHALINGDVAAAWHYNMALPFIVAFMLFAAVVNAAPRRWPRLSRVLSSRTVLLGVLALIVAWTIVRNLVTGL